jgi:hypothetical protein
VTSGLDQNLFARNTTFPIAHEYAMSAAERICELVILVRTEDKKSRMSKGKQWKPKSECLVSDGWRKHL